MSDEITEAATTAVRAAIVKAMIRPASVFFAVVGQRLDLIVADEYEGRPIPTAATDGRRLYVNPEYFLSLISAKHVTVIVHEWMHVVGGHNLRRGDRDQMLWNVACDHVVNLLLLEAGFEIDKAWVMDRWSDGTPSYKYRGWSPERVYADLVAQGYQPPEQDEDPGPGDEAGDGEPGDEQSTGGEASDEQGPELPEPQGEVWDATGDDGDVLNPEEKQEFERQLRHDIAEAKIVQKSSGSAMGEGTEYMVGKSLSPSAKWEDVLQDVWSDADSQKRDSWGVVNRRHDSDEMGYFLPGEEGIGLDWVVVAVDVSSSISMPELHAFITQLDKLNDEMPAERLTIVPFTQKVQHSKIQHVTGGDKIPRKFHIGGGTRFSAVTEWVDKKDEKPDVLILFTDLEDWEYGPEPDCPVIWASTEPVYEKGSFSNRPPFGQVIEVEAI
jgi:predicted metal-dependent peptidase